MRSTHLVVSDVLAIDRDMHLLHLNSTPTTRGEQLEPLAVASRGRSRREHSFAGERLEVEVELVGVLACTGDERRPFLVCPFAVRHVDLVEAGRDRRLRGGEAGEEWTRKSYTVQVEAEQGKLSVSWAAMLHASPSEKREPLTKLRDPTRGGAWSSKALAMV